jgi:Ni,Fe-hydrogenase I cytochrome b subunit
MDESRRTNLAIALAAPFVAVVMIVLAILAGLAYYLAAVAQGFWGLCRGVPGWVLDLKAKPPLLKPHFLKVPSKTLER